MLVSNNTNLVIRHNVHNESQFNIKTTAHAFEILSSGLYSDGITAIIRELSCNAIDAHVAAQTQDVPFEIHLPSELEPWFYVKDYGTGLSPDDVTGLYPTYFDSTKTNSNDFIGALGLGSKSPFAYTKSFEVSSRYNSTQYTFVAYLNEQNVPTISLMGTSETAEPNGLTVKLAVRNQDFAAFNTKTVSVVKWISSPYNIVGGTGKPSESNAKLPTPIVSGTNWALLPTYPAANAHFIAVQGHIAYTIQLANVAKSRALMGIINHTRLQLVCWFTIGELAIAASREELRYTKQTIDAINARLAQVDDELIGFFNESVSQYTTIWEVCAHLNGWSKSWFGVHSAIWAKLLSQSNMTVCPNLQACIGLNGQITVQLPKETEISTDGITRLVDSTAWEIGLYSNASGRISKRHTYQSRDIIVPTPGTIVVINDLKTKFASRIATLLQRHSAVIVIRKNRLAKIVDDSSRQPRPLTSAEYDDRLAKILAMLHLSSSHVKYLSTVPQSDATHVVSSQAPLTSTMSGVYRYTGVEVDRYANKVKFKWAHITKDDFSFDAGGIYIGMTNSSKSMLMINPLTNAPVRHQELKLQTHTMHDWIALINKHSDVGRQFTAKDVYGVTKSQLAKFVDSDKWFNLHDLLVDIVPLYTHVFEHLKRKNHANYRTWYSALRGRKSNTTKLPSELETIIAGLTPDSKFRTTIMSIAADVEQYLGVINDSKVENLIQFDVAYGHKLSSTAPIVFLDNDSIPLTKHYPMLQFASFNLSNLNTTELTTIAEYIKLIDERTLNVEN